MSRSGAGLCTIGEQSDGPDPRRQAPFEKFKEASMRMGIFTPLVGRQAGGPETYERNLVQSIAALILEDSIDVFCVSEHGRVALGIDQPNVRVHVLRPQTPWVSIPLGFPWALLRHRINFYHATVVPPPFSPVPYVFTMHDVAPFVRPGFYPASVRRSLSRLIARGLRRAERIICISEHTRQATAERFGVSEDKMVVIHHGVSDEFRPTPEPEARARVQRDLGVSDPYMLYLGKLEKRKNIVRLVKAFSRFRRESATDLKLVLAGKRTWALPELDETVTSLKLKDHVVELGYIPQTTIPPLLSAAACFVFPSLWEGFGLPVLEAMACGAPVITSDVSCMPEIAGEAALLVNPESTEEIAHAMYRVSHDVTLRQSMVQKGLVRATEFTWHRAAQRTVEVYRQVCSRRG